MEKKLLLYLLYSALIDIRQRSYENNDKESFGICDLLHNIPLALAAEEDSKDTYERLCEKVEAMGVQDWLSSRKEEFYQRYPEYKKL
ncbi:hypothetical protein [Paraflavitalea speifideaquila]|uniref:hypothetical protein n=1 Tax=Paraflavitalea speifideaquila TaxID=3076558 RepID=UPI0028EEEA68|nr:hypothetical protein [Paraflavitalea speifideiaquila]